MKPILGIKNADNEGRNIMARFTDADMKNYSLIKSLVPRGCTICGTPTLYIEYICEERVCSKECRDEMYKSIEEYMKEEG